MADPTPRELAELAKAAGIVTGENLRRDDDYLFRSMGTPTNVFGRHLIEFGLAAYRRGLADGFRFPKDGAAAAAAEGVAQFASASICGNCDTEVPPGCSGLFKDDGRHCALNSTAGVAPCDGGQQP